MANLTLTPTWEADIYQLETTDPVLGGAGGISNRHAEQLGNRTEYLKQVVDDHGIRVDTLETETTNLARIVGAGSFVKHGIVTAPLTNNVFDFITVAKITTSPILNRVTLYASSTSPLILTFSKGYDANGPILYYARVTSNQFVSMGSNSDALIYAEYNESTDAVTFGATNATTSHVISYSDPGTTGYWYSLKDEKLYLWNGTSWDVVVQVVIGKANWSGSGSFTMYQPVGKSIKDIYGRGQVPSGTVNAFAGATAPDGYLLCNGGAISRAIYSDLFSAIGTIYGVGNGTTTFNLPDMRGEFIRGLDGGRGIDLNSLSVTGSITNGSANVTVSSTAELAAGMTVSGTGIPVGATIASITSSTVFVLSANATATNASAALTIAGRMLGSWQPSTRIQAHVGTQGSQLAVAAQYPDASETYSIPGQTGTSFGSSQSFTRSLVRPRNVAMNFIIKF